MPEWIEAFRRSGTGHGSRYYASLSSMWKAGATEWTLGLPIPNQSTVQGWVRNKALLSCSRKQQKDVKSKSQMQQKRELMAAWTQRCMDLLGFIISAKRLNELEDHTAFLVVGMHCLVTYLSKPQILFNMLLVSKEVNAAVMGTKEYSSLMEQQANDADLNSCRNRTVLHATKDVFSSNRNH